MPASSVEASGVSTDAITKSFQTVTLLEAWLLMGSFGRCCRGEIGGEALQDVRVYSYRTSLRYSHKFPWSTRKETQWCLRCAYLRDGPAGCAIPVEKAPRQDAFLNTIPLVCSVRYMNHKHLPEVALMLTVLGPPVTPMISHSLGVSEDASRIIKHGNAVRNSAIAKIGLNKGRTYESTTHSNLANMGDAF